MQGSGKKCPTQPPGQAGEKYPTQPPGQASGAGSQQRWLLVLSSKGGSHDSFQDALKTEWGPSKAMC